MEGVSGWIFFESIVYFLRDRILNSVSFRLELACTKVVQV